MLINIPLLGVQLPTSDGPSLWLLLDLIIAEQPVAPSAFLAPHAVAADIDATLLGHRGLGEFPVGVEALENLLLGLGQLVCVLVARAGGDVRGIGAFVGDVEGAAEDLGTLFVVDVLADVAERAVVVGVFATMSVELLVETEALVVLRSLATDVLDLVCLGRGFVVKVKVRARVLARLVDDGTLDRRIFGVL